MLNAAMLRGNLIARGHFDSLPIPFRAIATDLGDRSAVVLDAGDLARAVRASIAIPLVLTPERVDGRFLADGGLVANIPVGIARRLGAARVIVSDATESLADSLNLYSPIRVADRLLGFLFHQTPDSLAATDIYIRSPVDGFASLDFGSRRVAQLIEVGARAATLALAHRADCNSRGPEPRAPIPLMLDTVLTPGANRAERRLLLRLLGLSSRHDIDVRTLRSRVRRLADSETFDAVWLQPTGSADRVSLELLPVRAAHRAAGLGLVYDNELGGRMWLGAVDRNVFARSIEGSALLQIGELRREAAWIQTTVSARGAAGNSDPHTFRGDGVDPPVRRGAGRTAADRDA